MATTKSEFQQLAAELFRDEFADFALPATFTQTTGFDYDTGKTTRSQTANVIRLSFVENEIDGELVKVGDAKIAMEQQLLSWLPTPDNTDVLFDGATWRVVRPIKDPADAVLMLHVRLK